MKDTDCTHYETAEGDCLTNACGGCCVKYRAEVDRLRAAATLAHAVLTRLADSAYQWAGRDVPVGLISEVDEAKAQLAGVIGE